MQVPLPLVPSNLDETPFALVHDFKGLGCFNSFIPCQPIIQNNLVDTQEHNLCMITHPANWGHLPQVVLQKVRRNECPFLSGRAKSAKETQPKRLANSEGHVQLLHLGTLVIGGHCHGQKSEQVITIGSKV